MTEAEAEELSVHGQKPVGKAGAETGEKLGRAERRDLHSQAQQGADIRLTAHGSHPGYFPMEIKLKTPQQGLEARVWPILCPQHLHCQGRRGHSTGAAWWQPPSRQAEGQVWVLWSGSLLRPLWAIGAWRTGTWPWLTRPWVVGTSHILPSRRPQRLPTTGNTGTREGSPPIWQGPGPWASEGG